MDNKDRKVLKQNGVPMSRNTEKRIEIHRGNSELGIKICKVQRWKTKCKSYFNWYYKTSSIIVVPTAKDIIMKTLSSLCSDSKGRGFTFKNYDIVKHLEFLGYAKAPLIGNLEAAPTSKNTSYIAYIEQKNAIFICEKVPNDSHTYQCLKNVAAMVKYFLTLYNREIQANGITVVGRLIRENENQQEIVECSFVTCLVRHIKTLNHLLPLTIGGNLSKTMKVGGIWRTLKNKTNYLITSHQKFYASLLSKKRVSQH